MDITVLTHADTNKSVFKTIHTTTSKVVGIFVLFHVLNHLFAIGSIAKHIVVMETFRIIYRHPLIEILLTISVVCQAVTGVALFWKGRKVREGIFDHLQAWSGLYMAFFFLVHMLAVFVLGRQILKVDTNFYFAAAGLLQFPSMLFFVPYYSLAIISFGTHITCSIRGLIGKRFGWITANRVAMVMLTFTLTATLFIMLAFSGQFYQVEMPK